MTVGMPLRMPLSTGSLGRRSDASAKACLWCAATRCCTRPALRSVASLRAISASAAISATAPTARSIGTVSYRRLRTLVQERTDLGRCGFRRAAVKEVGMTTFARKTATAIGLHRECFGSIPNPPIRLRPPPVRGLSRRRVLQLARARPATLTLAGPAPGRAETPRHPLPHRHRGAGLCAGEV
jgi:hypothetical protein